MTKHLAFIALVAAATSACEQNRGISNPAASFETSLEAQRVLGAVEGWRAVYTLTNQVAGSAVAVFNRAADGTLSAAGTIATGGTGTGGSLGSQGAVALSEDARRWRRPVGRRSGSPSATATTSSCRKPRARPRPMCWTPEISRS